MYKSSCFDGYYPNGLAWITWDSSWRTCTTENKCTSWESHMFLDSITQFGSHCLNGEYYDNTGRNWNGSCEEKCGYQSHWFSWGSTETFDLESMKWVTTWDPPYFMINSTQMNLPSI